MCVFRLLYGNTEQIDASGSKYEYHLRYAQFEFQLEH
jgi:hypothetical protein